jgi:glycosyltransferase involved in cell wall biosynthesis
VNIIRRGGFYTVYIWAAIYYVLKLRGKFDLVIDSENGVPFFTPLYVRVTKFLLIHHIHQEVFREHLPFPFSHIAMLIESKLMPFVYRDVKVLTVSQSSKEAIYKIGLSKKKDVTVINPGIESELFKVGKKTKHPSIVYVGRLKPYKNVDVALKAFAHVAEAIPNAHFDIAGDGESISSLRRMATKLDLNDNVTFWGKVSDEVKAELYAKSWVAVQPSLIEGWGITVIEANACGTPVIASNVAGLSDSVVDKKTGYLVRPKHVTELSEAMFKLLTNSRIRKRLSIYASDWAEQFTWRNAIDKLLADVKEIEGTDSLITTKSTIMFQTK